MTEHDIRVTARDGFVLRGTLYCPNDDVRGVVVFNPGGGAAATHYRNFLRHLASHQLAVIAYDYRGIGRSAPTTRENFDAGIEDWAELDQASVVDFALHRFPGQRISSVSHSIGCMIAAAAPNASKLNQFVFVAPHTGYWGDYHPWFRWPMGLVWHVAMPLVVRVLGYFPASKLGLGDDFPRRFALQWAGRLGPDFNFGAYGGNVEREYGLLDRMTALKNRALIVTAFDDCFATDTAIRRFSMAMPHLSLVRRELGSPTEKVALGHWGFFRRRHSSHWRIVSEFILGTPPKCMLAAEWITEPDEWP
jgi:predicted alpha/beta hydrolase